MAGGKEKIRQVALSFPGFLELLPRYDQCCYVKTIGAGSRYIDIFDATEWKKLDWLPPQIASDPGRFAQFRTNLDRARSLSDLLRTPAPGVIEVKFAGDAHPTRSFLGMLSNATQPDSSNWTFGKDLGDGTVFGPSAARNPKLDSLEGGLESFAEHATIFDDQWVVAEIRHELTTLGELHRQPISGSGHPTISKVVDGVQRDWKIVSLEITVTKPYLTASDKIEGVATIKFEGPTPGLRNGLVIPEILIDRKGAASRLSFLERTTPEDILENQIVYKFDSSGVALKEGTAEVILNMPEASRPTRAIARVAIQEP
jgi:hypothetical protein